MISANELRIGNYLLSVKTGKPVIVDWLVIKHIQDGNRQCPPYDMSLVYEPIKLTEDLLLKCGYTESQLETGRILIVEKGGFIIRPLSDRVIVKYLHQLQNLYFALTGKELEVNL